MNLSRYAADLSIRAKLLVSFTFILAVMITVSVTVYQKVCFIQSVSLWRAHTVAVIDNVQNLKQAMVDQETGVRGYLLSGDAGFLEPFRQGQATYIQAMQQAKTLVVDNPSQEARLDQLGGFAASWNGDVSDKEIAPMGNPSTQVDARRIETTGTGKRAMDGIRGKITEIIGVERTLMAERISIQKAAYHRTYVTLVAGGITSVAIAGLG